MPSKQEKERRRQIQLELAKKEKDSFLNSLPLPEELLASLLDFLDVEVGTTGCQHNYVLTSKFIKSRNLELNDTTIKWFQEHGGFCDCEIFYNIEEKFE